MIVNNINKLDNQFFLIKLYLIISISFNNNSPSLLKFIIRLFNELYFSKLLY